MLSLPVFRLFNYCSCVCFVFFFKQKTAYEMRISDWSSDVCSSDLPAGLGEALERFAPCCAGIVDADVAALFARFEFRRERAAAFDGREVDRQADDLARIARFENGDTTLDIRALQPRALTPRAPRGAKSTNDPSATPPPAPRPQ